MSRKFLVPLVLPANPTQPLEAATKQYVDAQAGGGAAEVFIGPGTPTDGAAISGTQPELWIDTDDPDVPVPSPQIFATKALLDAWAAPNGTLATTTDTGTMWIRRAGIWVPAGGVTPSGLRHLSANYSIPNAAWTQVVFNQTGFVRLMNVNGGYLQTIYKGIYTVTAGVLWDGGAGGNWRSAVIANTGKAWSWAESQTPPSTMGPYLTLAVQIEMNAGENVGLFVYQDSGAAKNVLAPAASSLCTRLDVSWVGPS